MRKVKITKNPHVGDQVDFSLIDNKGFVSGKTPTFGNNSIKQTLGPIPREEANIEAEHNETVLGDINNDGLLEHFRFVGDSHANGGIPQNIPPGSFIFSNTKKLKIKDPNVLDFFALNPKKGGYTPGEIARRYDINTHINNLKAEDSDYITKNTAQEMLKTNTEKLAMLALIQESMKGFPNGIPDFAQSAVGYLDDKQQTMKFGGTVQKFQAGGEISLTPDQVIYINGKKYQYQTHNDPGLFSYNEIIFKNVEGTDKYHPATVKVSENTLKDLLKSNEVDYANKGTANELKLQYSLKPGGNNPYSQPNIIGGEKFSAGDVFYVGKQKYKVIDPYAKVEDNYTVGSGNSYTMGTSSSVRKGYQDALKVIPINEKGVEGSPTYIKSKDIKTAKSGNTYKKLTSAQVKSEEEAAKGDTWGAQEQTSPTVVQSNPVPKTVYQGKTNVSGVYKGQGSSAPIKKPEEQNIYSQYGSEAIQGILAKNANTKYTNIQFGKFGAQGKLGNTGIYLSSNNAASHKAGDLSPEEWEDFKTRHGDWIDKEYVSANGKGFEAFQKDLRQGNVSGDAASGWFQDKVNEKTQKEFGTDYFDKNDKSTPYARDSKFGQVTFSVPRFFEMPQPVEGSLESPEETIKEEPVIEEQAPLEAEQRKGPGTWWLPDITNFVGSMTDKINRYEPVLSKLTSDTPGYVTKDPTRMLAANQEQMARYQSQVSNSLRPNVAAATMLGASGEGFANAANVIGAVENDNVGIVNTAYANNAQIENATNQYNNAALQKYIGESATLNQNIDNATNLRKWRQIGMFNQGTDNWFKKKQMEQVLFPQVFIDPITGDAQFSGKGRDVFEPDTYVNPMYGSAGSNPNTLVDNGMGIYDRAYKQHLDMYNNSELAHKFAQEQMSLVGRKYSQAYSNPNATNYEFGGTVLTIDDFINNK